MSNEDLNDLAAFVAVARERLLHNIPVKTYLHILAVWLGIN